MIDRYLLRYFLAVIDYGNFSKAAFHCSVSQPTLSVGVAKLEQELGRLLFRRTNRRVEVTEAGARFAAHARRIEAEFALAEREVRESVVSPALRIGILTTIPRSWIETFIFRLKTEAPDEKIELVEGREQDLVEHLERGRVDAALTIIRAEDGRFVSDLLCSEGYSLAMSAGHPLAGRPSVLAEELGGNAMILRRQCELLAETSRHFTARGVRPFFAARTLDDDRALGYIRAGLGVTVVPDSFREPGIVLSRIAGFRFTRDIGILYGSPSGRSILRNGRVIATLTDVIANLQADLVTA